MSSPTNFFVQHLLAEVEDGDELGWQAEFQWLWAMDTKAMAALTADISRHGVREPIEIGIEGEKLRMWDGHHRVAAAVALNLKYIPAVLIRVNEVEASNDD